MANRANFGSLLEPGFFKIFNDAFKEVPQVYPQIFNVDGSSKDVERSDGVTGFGLWIQTAEETPINYEEPIQMYDISFEHKKYTKAFKVTLEMWEDDQYSVMKKKPAELGRAGRRTQENYAANIFDNAFTSTQTGGDGQELCSTVHPRADGGATQSNASATGIVFSEDNLETGIIAMRKQLDDKGQIIDVFPDTLLGPVELRKTMRLVVESPMRQGTADNDKNIYQNELKVIDWRYLDGSTTAWFLIDSQQQKLQWFNRVAPQFFQDNAFDTEQALYKGRMRFSVGFHDWRGIWGSKGDAAAYAG